MRWRGWAGLSILAASVPGLAACVPVQSALHPAGTDAADVVRLFWGMTMAGALIWTVVMAVTLYAVLGRRRPRSDAFADRFILAGGVLFPTVTLGVLLAYGLTLMPGWAQRTADLRVQVRAEQFWWRVTYDRPGAAPLETANEVHLPAGRVAEFEITSPDVIHSFWIPVLGGKMDAIPGRTTRLQLSPTTPGRYRGVCAEFCGTGHALMAFDVVVHAPEDFDRWLEAEARPAEVVETGPFVRAGCPACHVIRGAVKGGRIGPDLTHLAARRHLAAGILPNTPENLRHWLIDPQAIKPGARMPTYAALPGAEIDALVALLGALE